MPSSPSPKETPHATPITLSADEFRRGPSYTNWRVHGTPDWLLILTVAGAGKVASGSTSVITKPGTITLYQPGTPQRYFTDPDTRHWHILWSHFHPKPDWAMWLKWPERAKGFRVIQIEDRAVLRQVRQALLDTVHLGRQRLPGSMDLAVNALERALLWIHSANDSSSLDERIRHALELMADRLNEPFSLPALAKGCGLSVSRLAHLFSQQIGVPPQQYLEELRLQRAAQLLRSTGLRISEIATETGYSGAFYFSSRFRKKFGKSPSQYRASP